MIICQYYVPAWKGSKTSNRQPDFCLKNKVKLYGRCLKDCNEKKESKKVKAAAHEDRQGRGKQK